MEPIYSEDAPEPRGWWGFGWNTSQPLSIVELVAAGNFSVHTAALLWLLIEARASIIVAANPSSAGKTTTLSALSDFLPPTVDRLYLRGWQETFAWRATADPTRTYLLCNEISAHLPIYLWGDNVAHLFDAAVAGFGFGATMHADTAEEVIGLLGDAPLAIAPTALARLDLVLTLAVDYRNRRPRRRLDALTFFPRDDATNAQVTLAHWDAGSDRAIDTATAHIPSLARRVGRTTESFASDHAQRTMFLTALLTRGIHTRRDVRRALAAYPDFPTPTGA